MSENIESNAESKYYVWLDGKQSGPYPETMLHSLHQTQVISSETLVALVGTGEWIPAGSITSLFPAANSAGATTAAPNHDGPNSQSLSSSKIPKTRRILLRTFVAISTVGLLFVFLLEHLAPNADRRLFRDTMVAAKAGDAEAQNKLGELYAEGKGVGKDESEAIRWYRVSAEKGFIEAELNLAGCFYNGHGVMQDRTEAIRLYTKAANAGHPSAQWILGYELVNGISVSRNTTEGIRWYRRAAEQGEPSALHNLGLAYGHGDGVPLDPLESVRLLRRAAEQGHARSQYSYAWCLNAGNWIPRDAVEAYKWLKLALKGEVGDQRERQNALKLIDDLRKELSSEQIHEAERLVSAFLPKKRQIEPPGEHTESISFADEFGLFEVKTLRILTGRRSVDERLLFPHQLENARSQRKQVFHFEVSVKSIGLAAC